jgi:two-component system sensor kinase FixL
MQERSSSQEGPWRSIIRSAVDAIVLIDSRGRIEAFNPAAERLFGYREAEVVGQNVSMLMPQPYRGEHDDYLARYLATADKKIIGIGREVIGQRRDGTTFPLHLAVGETEVDGEKKFTGIIHDLSTRVNLEDRLRASEARWRSILESAVDAIVVIDARGCIEWFNPAAERMFGYAEADMIGKNVNILMPSPYHEEHDGYMAHYLATGEKRIIGIGRQVTGRRRDGTTFPVRLSVGEMQVNGERKFTGILADLSARVRMEEQLREQTSLARLGEMAAVIAHEVKNPLAGIRGAIQVIGGRLPKESKDATVVKEIVNRIDTLNELIKDLLLFARPPHPRPLPVDLAGLVRTTADLLAGDPALKGVAIHIDGDAPPVMADAELLKIVFQNLLVNSAQAMQGRGEIRVTLEPLDGVCRVMVRDAGPGIAADVRERIFTPFFTTKARGTGLGLATARRIVEAHAGRIAIDSAMGDGTTVTIELPVTSLTI